MLKEDQSPCLENKRGSESHTYHTYNDFTILLVLGEHSKLEFGYLLSPKLVETEFLCEEEIHSTTIILVPTTREQEYYV